MKKIILISCFFVGMLLSSCQTNDSIENERVSEVPKSYEYRITENLILESDLSLPVFDIDSLDTYSWYGEHGKYTFIKDNEDKYYFSTLIAEIHPALLNEGVYSDPNNAKIKYFIYDDNDLANENRDRVFCGVRISESEQSKLQVLIDSYEDKPCFPLMWTPTRKESNNNLPQGFCPIKGYTEKGDIIVSDQSGNDSVITIEPITRKRFGRKDN